MGVIYNRVHRESDGKYYFLTTEIWRSRIRIVKFRVSSTDC